MTVRTIKIRLKEYTKKDGKLSGVVSAELLEDRPHSVLVKLSNGDVIVRKKPQQVVSE